MSSKDRYSEEFRDARRLVGMGYPCPVFPYSLKGIDDRLKPHLRHLLHLKPLPQTKNLHRSRRHKRWWPELSLGSSTTVEPSASAGEE
ncbi:hypothetical protein AMTR_s00008p00227110 [Amborella trichopoda]|uniref:Uncharacterized protein n=1 Tax=Amborella trichopoda TaxID=13333 RepID=W1NIV9_AMBTC|nr:hypothetical protein AMTR_s00008p00227110 [Amborella trichopoda]